MFNHVLIKRSHLILTPLLLLSLKANAQGLVLNFPGDLIYGNDDRVEIDYYPNQSFVEFGNSIALRVSKRRLTEDRNNANRILFPFIYLKNAIPNICKDEKFVDQISLGNCSGFLVGKKTLVTAGHCMVNARECADNKWVFGFKEGVTELVKDQVYSCKKIISQRYVYSENEVSDYAVIELDREVTNAKPLETRKFGMIITGTPLVVIGHPLGLPMKATDGAKVQRMNDLERESTLRSLYLRSHYFTTNLDSYAGNSGSPVFNKRTGKVEGILIQGAEDFEYNPDRECMESKKLSNSHHESYEKVMRIKSVPGLPKL
ncbi:MAG: serine protease [Bdellovibrionales bacterium]|nr:serine protease [Bdellovibrionales bacterium]